MRSPESDVPLAAFTTLRVGGRARYYVVADSIDHVADADAWARERGLPLTILAGGSNVLITDDDVEGLVLHLRARGMSRHEEGEHVMLTVAAGEPWDEFVAATVAQNLAGLECLSGIPGTVGGTPIQNVGAYGQDVAKTIDSVTVFDRVSLTQESLSAEDCEFGYRTSRFKGRDTGRYVVCQVTFRLCVGGATVTYPDLVDHLQAQGVTNPSVKAARDAVLAVRRAKGMVLDSSDEDTRSVGSFFTNPVLDAATVEEIASESGRHVPAYPAGPGMIKVSAAWLLEQVGCGKGYGKGPVGISSKHSLAVINRGGASAREVVDFAVGIKRRVADRFGVWLIPEPSFVGFGQDDGVTYLLSGTHDSETEALADS